MGWARKKKLPDEINAKLSAIPQQVEATAQQQSTSPDASDTQSGTTNVLGKPQNFNNFLYSNPKLYENMIRDRLMQTNEAETLFIDPSFEKEIRENPQRLLTEAGQIQMEKDQFDKLLEALGNNGVEPPKIREIAKKRSEIGKQPMDYQVFNEILGEDNVARIRADSKVDFYKKNFLTRDEKRDLKPDLEYLNIDNVVQFALENNILNREANRDLRDYQREQRVMEITQAQVLYAHKMGLGGSVTIDAEGHRFEASLEGFDISHTLPACNQSVQSFSQSDAWQNSNPDSDNTMKALKVVEGTYERYNRIFQAEGGLDDSRNWLETAKAYRNGEPVMFESRWQGHSAMTILYKDRIYICNKGAGTSKPSIKSYKIGNVDALLGENENDTALKISLMSRTERKDSRLIGEFSGLVPGVGKKFSNVEFMRDLELTRDKVNPVKGQVIGNCSYTNTKRGFHGILAALEDRHQLDGSPTPEDFPQSWRAKQVEGVGSIEGLDISQVNCSALYRAFGQHDRLEMIKQYMAKIDGLGLSNDELLEKGLLDVLFINLKQQNDINSERNVAVGQAIVAQLREKGLTDAEIVERTLAVKQEFEKPSIILRRYFESEHEELSPKLRTRARKDLLFNAAKGGTIIQTKEFLKTIGIEHDSVELSDAEKQVKSKVEDVANNDENLRAVVIEQAGMYLEGKYIEPLINPVVKMAHKLPISKIKAQFEDILAKARSISPKNEPIKQENAAQVSAAPSSEQTAPDPADPKGIKALEKSISPSTIYPQLIQKDLSVCMDSSLPEDERVQAWERLKVYQERNFAVYRREVEHFQQERGLDTVTLNLEKPLGPGTQEQMQEQVQQRKTQAKQQIAATYNERIANVITQELTQYAEGDKQLGEERLAVCQRMHPQVYRETAQAFQQSWDQKQAQQAEAAQTKASGPEEGRKSTHKSNLSKARQLFVDELRSVGQAVKAELSTEQKPKSPSSSSRRSFMSDHKASSNKPTLTEPGNFFADNPLNLTAQLQRDINSSPSLESAYARIQRIIENPNKNEYSLGADSHKTLMEFQDKIKSEIDRRNPQASERAALK